MEFRTEIKDSKLALAAIEAACLPWTRESRTRIRIGEGGHAVLDTTTGLVSGESVTLNTMVDRLRQHYAEATYKQEAARQGIEILSRAIRNDGDIVLMCRFRGDVRRSSARDRPPPTRRKVGST